VNRFLPTLIVLAALFCAAGITSPAVAEIDFAASLSIPLDDDGRVFINVASNHYHADPDLVVFASNRLRHPVVELPIVLFLAEHAHRRPRAIINLRLSGHSWIDIFVSFGLPYDILFVDLPRDPGPPYGRAWGYWKKHRAHPRTRIILTDAEFADLVHLHVTSRALGVAPREVIRLRAQGRPFKAIAGNTWRAKHGRGPGASAAGRASGGSSGNPSGRPPGGGKPSSGKSQGAGKNKPRGSGKP